VSGNSFNTALGVVVRVCVVALRVAAGSVNADALTARSTTKLEIRRDIMTEKGAETSQVVRNVGNKSGLAISMSKLSSRSKR
jgi:hypothetical protein